MNMLLHGIGHATSPGRHYSQAQHKDDNNELKSYDRVLANPPFSQNYIRKRSSSPAASCLHAEKGKKAD